MQVRQKVKAKPELHQEFPQLLDADCHIGVVEAVRIVAGIEICLVSFDNGVIKKLPSSFLVPLQRG
jgi:hypothetical protein